MKFVNEVVSKELKREKKILSFYRKLAMSPPPPPNLLRSVSML